MSFHVYAYGSYKFLRKREEKKIRKIKMILPKLIFILLYKF